MRKTVLNSGKLRREIQAHLETNIFTYATGHPESFVAIRPRQPMDRAMIKAYQQAQYDSSSMDSVKAARENLSSLPEFWDSLASYAFMPAQGRADIALFLRLQAIAESSPAHDELMSGFWDAAFDGVPRPARPRND